MASCSPYLRKGLHDELAESSDFYEMYDFQYFVDQVDIEEFDSSIETDFLFSILENIFTETKTYNVSGVFSSFMEIEQDANDKAGTLHNEAKSLFRELLVGISGILDEIGKDLPESDEKTTGDYLKRILRTREGTT